ncbi:MAG: hypothetical protein FJX57_03295 [Alphaproteobacteria bacterium]|nr:hypothetical protein [Alphaproteobacteria bacterium]
MRAKTALLVTLGVVTLLAPIAQAATITTTTNDAALGAFSANIMGAGPGSGENALPIGQTFMTNFASARGPGINHFFTGKVIAENVGGTLFRLTLTEFE